MIERCLAKDPRSRPTAAQLLAELSTALPPALPRPGPGPGLGPPAPYGAGHVPALPTQLATESAALSPASPPAWGPTVSAPPPRLAGPTLPPVTGSPMPPTGPELPRITASPVPPGYDRRVAPPPRRRRPFRPGQLAAIAAAVVLAAGAGAFLAAKAEHMGGHARPASASSAAVNPTTPVTTGSSSATQLPGAATMAAIGSDLAQSASVRPTVQPAIDGVRNCSESPQSGEATLQHAISTRQDILTGLQALSPSRLTSGAQMISTLETAMQDSINADKGYQAWMTDFANAGSPCGSDPGQDSNYVAGQDASSAATTAKDAFLAIWNPMAPRYGQPTHTNADF